MHEKYTSDILLSYKSIVCTGRDYSRSTFEEPLSQRMVVLSKLSKVSSYSYHGVSLSQAACTAAIAAYLGGVLYPRWRKYKQKPARTELSLSGDGSSKDKSGPSVNRDFFVQLRRLLKVSVIKCCEGENKNFIF